VSFPQTCTPAKVLVYLKKSTNTIKYNVQIKLHDNPLKVTIVSISPLQIHHKTKDTEAGLDSFYYLPIALAENPSSVPAICSPFKLLLSDGSPANDIALLYFTKV